MHSFNHMLHIADLNIHTDIFNKGLSWIRMVACSEIEESQLNIEPRCWASIKTRRTSAYRNGFALS